MTDNNPLAPHALQTAVATMVERLLIEASYPAKGKDCEKLDRRFIAREQLGRLIESLTMRDLTDAETVTPQIHTFCRFRDYPQQVKIVTDSFNNR